jgi:hypothetical protein
MIRENRHHKSGYAHNRNNCYMNIMLAVDWQYFALSNEIDNAFIPWNMKLPSPQNNPVQQS